MATSHYQLTLFESDDKPTWLEDWNHTMTQLDEILYRISSGGGDLPDLSEVVARLQALEGRVDSDELEINEIQGYISTIQADITAINETISGIQSDISSVQSDVSGLTSDLETLSETVGTLSTSLSSLSTRVGTAETNISGLDTRVTALENASGGVSITKLNQITAYSPATLNALLSEYDLLFIPDPGIKETYASYSPQYNGGLILDSLYNNTSYQYMLIFSDYYQFYATSYNGNFTPKTQNNFSIITTPYVYGVKI